MQWLERLQGKNKARPTKDELIKGVDLHFNGCGCEASSHTIFEERNGYTYTISRTFKQSKDKR